MEVNCEGCAGCCIDWRPLSPIPLDHERRGGRRPLDDVYNLVALTRDEVRRFVASGYGDALAPRLWYPVERDDRVRIDGYELAAIEGRPVFVVGLRKTPKPVAPFEGDRRWLRACVFLDPATLQCRIHDDRLYPGECADYPGHNLALDRETECERVERVHGGVRLLDRGDPPTRHLRLGPGALGSTVFAHPDPDRLDGVVDRLVTGDARTSDRAEFVGWAVASSPGSLAVDAERAATTREEVLAASSWVGRAVDRWTALVGDIGDDAADLDEDEHGRVEEREGAPPTPGWEDERDERPRDGDGDGGRQESGDADGRGEGEDVGGRRGTGDADGGKG
ncbi:YkgJ family cysteine cluster protein [Salinigranum sp. GCM10025319]|uniref:YkgJ family cysteine cluster protein n=1 Tax=Salinigranum sp. GCM10025319 TaxID=3252687 RepID=UPI0036074FC1